MTYTYTPRGVCSRKMTVELENGVIKSVSVEGGCNGNLQGIADGERKKRLERGVTINGEDCRLSIVEPGEHTGPADLVIIAVKDYALEEALAAERA